MATLVKFRKYDVMFSDTPQRVFAYFPQLNHNKRLYGNDMKVCYDSIGQHSPCSKDYSKATPANESEYLPLKQELENIGYNLKICK